mmetsp:Transcript_23409/g.34738  ORF Transcript_23409/g.34738 Transcript_23409/m.34738 type:complete len:208 (+) Transcript_23409:1231-1854(+)
MQTRNSPTAVIQWIFHKLRLKMKHFEKCTSFKLWWNVVRSSFMQMNVRMRMCVPIWMRWRKWGRLMLKDRLTVSWKMRCLRMRDSLRMALTNQRKTRRLQRRRKKWPTKRRKKKRLPRRRRKKKRLPMRRKKKKMPVTRAITNLLPPRVRVYKSMKQMKRQIGKGSMKTCHIKMSKTNQNNRHHHPLRRMTCQKRRAKMITKVMGLE